MATIRLAINGKPYNIETDPQTSLLTVLREHLDLTGTKYGCGEGHCGACTVLIDGKAQRSCMTRVGVIAQKQITTIEGLASGDRLHPVQQAFLDAGAMQCAYCTSGMIMSAVALLQKNPHPQEKEIIEKALRDCRGRVSGRNGAATILGIPASTLESRIRSLKINKYSFKAD